MMFPIILDGIVLGLYIVLRCVLWMLDNRNSHTAEWRDQRITEWIKRELPALPPLSEEDPSHPAFTGWSPDSGRVLPRLARRRARNCRLNGHVFTDSNYCEVCRVWRNWRNDYYGTEY